MIDVLLTPDEGRQRPRAAPSAAAAGANDSIERQGLGDALQLVRALLLDDEEPGHLALHASGDQDRPWLSRSLDARRDVGRVAEHLAGGVDHDRPGLEADARGKLRRASCGVPGIEVGKRALDRQRGPHGALGVVLLRLRIAEERHQPVAELLQHVAAKIGHRLRRLVEIGVDEVAPVLGVELRGEARRADKIAEHHCDRTALGSVRRTMVAARGSSAAQLAPSARQTARSP